MSDDTGLEGQGVVLFLCMGQPPVSSLEYKLLDISKLCLIPSPIRRDEMNAELESLAQTILEAYQRYVPLEGNSNEQHTSRPAPSDRHSWVSP